MKKLYIMHYLNKTWSSFFRNLCLSIFLLLSIFENAQSQGNYALKLDGVDDFVTADVVCNELNGTDRFTMEAWIKPTYTNGQRFILTFHKADYSNHLLLGIRDGKMVVCTNFNGIDNNYYGTTTIPVNEWTHIVMANNINQGTLFINGIEEQLTIVNNIVSYFIIPAISAGERFSIGQDWDASTPTDFFAGEIDEVRIWKSSYRNELMFYRTRYRKAAPNEKDLIAYYDMDSPLGASLTDNCTNNTTYCNGTLHSAPTLVPAGISAGPGQALKLNGTTQYAEFENVYIHNGFDRTIEVWAKYDELFPDHKSTIVMSNGVGSDVDRMYNVDYSIIINPDRTLACFMEYGDGVNELCTSSVPAPVSAGTWHHYALVRKELTVTFYVDGLKLGTTQSFPYYPQFTSYGHVFVGAETVMSTGQVLNQFKGEIDELRVWQAIRSETQIRDDMMNTNTDLGEYFYCNFNRTFGNLLGSNSKEPTDDAIKGSVRYYTGEQWPISEAFTVWTGFESSDWSNAANWSNGLPSSNTNVGIYPSNVLPDTRKITISGNPTVNNLVISSGSNPTLSSDITVTGKLFINESVNLNGKNIILGPSANLYEDSNNLYTSSGGFKTTRNLNNPNNENPANLGAIITTTADLGSTTIIRGHVAQTGGSNSSVKRYFDISSANNNQGLDATINFNYFTPELNGLSEANLKLFSSTNGGSSWIEEGGVADADNNSVTKTKSIESLNKRWTAAENIMVVPSTPAYTNQNNAIKFDGIDDRIPVTDASVNLSGNFTIESWINPSAIGAKQGIVTKHGLQYEGYSDPTHPRNYEVGLVLRETGLITLYIGDRSGSYSWPWAGLNSTSVISANTWTHVAAVMSGTEMKLYINGKLEGTKTYTCLRPYDSTGLLRIAEDLENRNKFNGMLDEIRIWSNPRTQDEIQSTMYKKLAGNEQSLMAYYNMDKGCGTTLDDNTGHGNSGIFSNGPVWRTSGSFSGSRNALQLTSTGNFSTNDYIQLDAAVSVPTTFTQEAWIYSNLPEDNQWHTLMGGDDSDPLHRAPCIYIWNNKSIHYGFGDGATWCCATISDIMPINTWNHLAVTFDGANYRLYLNGKEILNDTSWAGKSPGTYGKITRIGEIGGDARSFTGKIDEIRIWNKALPWNTIRDNMMKTLVGNEDGLLAYYRFDQAEGTKLWDIAGSDNNGTLINMAGTEWINSEAFNTWLGVESSDWNTVTNWSSGIPAATDNTGIYIFPNGHEATISGNPTVNTMLLTSDSSPVLSSNFTVNGNLIANKASDLSGQIITLGPTSLLVESLGREFYGNGAITTTRNLSNISNENIANMGATITTAANMGSTTVTRGHTSYTAGLHNSVKRYFDITPANNSSLNATLTFHYIDNEINGLPEDRMKLFRSTNSGSTWALAGGTALPSSNAVSLSGISSFSRWTVSTTAVVTAVTSSKANGSYSSGTVIPITVTFSENVTVTGTPRLTLETGNIDAVVNYSSGSGTNTLTFNYTVAAGQYTTDLDYKTTSALALNGGTIKDASGSAATLTLFSPGTTGSLGANKNIAIVDAVAPKISSVSLAANNSTVTATMSEPVYTNTGASGALTAADFVLSITGGTATLASTTPTSISISGNIYTLGISYNGTPNGSETLKVNPVSGTAIYDGANNPAAASQSNNTVILHDQLSPTVTNVTSSKVNGSYKSGTDILITVSFSENVKVTGTPKLTLETGSSDALVPYTSGSNTNTLTFKYTVGSGQNSSDLDYTSTSALILNGGTIKDAAANAATLTLSAPGASGSLGANKNIVVDTQAPAGYSVSIDQAFINNSNKSAIAFTFTSAEIGTTYNYTFSSAGGGTAVTGSGLISLATQKISNINLSGLNDGLVTLNVTLTDVAGNTGSVTTDSKTKDVVAPSGYSVNINQACINNSNQTAAGFTFTAAEVETTYSYTITSTGGGTDVTGTGAITTSNQQVSNINLSGLGDGTITLSVSLTDVAGNISIPATNTKTKDTGTPFAYTVSIDQSYINNSNKTAASFTFSGAETGTVFYYTFSSTGGGTNVTGTGTINNSNQQIPNINLSGLEDGTITLSVTLTDDAGNTGVASTASKTKDTILPSGYSVSIDQSHINNSNQTATSFTFSGAETGTTYNYTITSTGGGTAVTGTGTINTTNEQISGINLSGLGDGTITFSVTLTDIAGNTGILATNSKTKDVVVPSGYSASIDQPFIISSNQSAASFTFSNAEVGANYQYTVSSSGGGIAVSGSGTISTAADQISGINLSGLGEGILTLNVTLSDAVGNTGITANDTKTKDLTAPSGYAVRINQAYINTNNQTTASFSFSGAETGSTYNYTISSDSGGTPVTGSATIATSSDRISPIDVTGLNDGNLTLSVTLTDPAGNTGSVATDTKIKNLALPDVYEVSIDQNYFNNSNKSAASFSYTGATDGATYNYTFSSDGGVATVTGTGTISGVSGQFTNIDLTGLADGTITLGFTLSTGAGHVATDVKTKDVLAPTGYSASIDQLYINDGNKNAATFTFAGAEVGTKYNYTISDGSGLNVIGTGIVNSATQKISNIDLSGLNDGNLTLTVSLTDVVLNTGNAATDTKTKDIVAPTAYSVNIEQSYINNNNQSTVSFRFTNAEVNAIYNYTISSTGGSANVTGTGTIASATDQISNINLSGLGNGTITLSVTLTDVAGNAGTAATDIKTKDAVVPAGYSVSIDQVYINSINKETASFTFANAEVGTTYNYTISSNGGGTNITGSGTINSASQKISNINLSGLNDGTITLNVSLTDAASNVGSVISNTKTKDVILPVGYSVAIDQAYINSSNQTAISFTFTGAEINTTYSYTISSSSGGTNITGTGTIGAANEQISGINMSGLNDGTLNLVATLTDVAGNTGVAVTNVKTKDTIAPAGYSAAIDQAYIVGANQSASSFTFTGAEVTSTYNYTISSTGGGANVTGTGTINAANEQISGIDLSGLGDGTITLTVSLTDVAGNTGSVASNTKIKDLIAPAGYSALFDQSKISNSNQIAASFSFGNAEIGTTYNYSISSSGSGSNVTGSGTIDASTGQIQNIDLNELGDGILTLKFILTDPAGNTGATANNSINKDVLAPSDYSVSIDQAYINSGNQSIASFTFAGTEISSTYNYTISSSGGGTSVTGTGTINSASDQISNINLSGLSDGTVSLSLTLTDEFGNTGSVVTSSKTKDTVAPAGFIVSIDQPYIVTSNKTAVSFTFASAEINSTYNYTISSAGGGTNVTGTGTIATATDQISGIDLIGLSDGLITLNVILTDVAGNTSSIVNSTKLKDELAPSAYSVSIDQTYINLNNKSNASFTFTGAEVSSTYNYTISSSGGGASVTGTGTVNSASEQISNINLNGLNDGTVTLSVTLRDMAGNTGNAATDTKTKSTDAPDGFSVYINQEYINFNNQSAVSFSFARAEVATIYNYTFSSSGGGVNVTGTGAVNSASDQISNIDLSGLADGIVSLSFTLTDMEGNTGSAATDSKIKDVVAPNNYTVAIDQAYINEQNQSAVSFSFSNAEIGSKYSYSVYSENGGFPKFGDGTITTTNGKINGIDLSGLNDGEITLYFCLEDEGNIGTTISSVRVKDVVAPSATVSFTKSENYKIGDIITLTATFDEEIKDGILPQISFSGGLIMPATNMTKTSSTVFVFDYTLTSVSNDISIALSKATDIAGNIVNSTPVSGSTLNFNARPTATNSTISVIENETYRMSILNFGYSDANSDPLSKITISEVSGKGKLFVDLNNNGIPEESEIIIAGTEIDADNISYIIFKPLQDEWSTNYLSFTFAPNDGTSNSIDTYRITFNVVEENTAPTTIAIPNLECDVKSNTQELDLSKYFFDAETPSESLTYQLKSNSNSSLFQELKINGNNLSMTFKNNISGTSEITIRAYDLHGLYVENNFELILINGPLINGAINISKNEDEEFTLCAANLMSYLCKDLNLQDESFSLTFNKGQHIRIEEMSDSTKFSPDENWFGLDSLDVQVSYQSQVAVTKLYVDIIPVNDVPYFIIDDEKIDGRDKDTTTIYLWNIVKDVEELSSLLQYELTTESNNLFMNFDQNTGTLKLSSKVDYSGSYNFKVKVSDKDLATTEKEFSFIVDQHTDINNILQSDYNVTLDQNYPNPFTNNTTIGFELPEECTVRLEIFSNTGTQVMELLNQQLPQGAHSVEVSGDKLSPGMYIYRLNAISEDGDNSIILSKKMIHK